jgi:hypothetical protein
MIRGVDGLNSRMQRDLSTIRDKDARAPQPVRSEAAIGELEWKMHSLMISSGLVLAPIVALLVIAGVLYLWLA